MYYIILFVAVLSFLAVAAWVDPTHRRMFARGGKLANHGTGHSAQTGHVAVSSTAQLLQGERKEDKPCLTPIDCVKDKRCAGHCGCR